MPTIIGILTFISRMNNTFWSFRLSISIYLGYVSIYEQFKFLCSAELSLKKSFITSGPGVQHTKYEATAHPSVLFVNIQTELTR